MGNVNYYCKLFSFRLKKEATVFDIIPQPVIPSYYFFYKDSGALHLKITCILCPLF